MASITFVDPFLSPRNPNANAGKDPKIEVGQFDLCRRRFKAARGVSFIKRAGALNGAPMLDAPPAGSIYYDCTLKRRVKTKKILFPGRLGLDFAPSLFHLRIA